MCVADPGEGYVVILHVDYTAESDMIRVIRDQLETQETVQVLRASTGQSADTYEGSVQVVHAPAVNYVVGHGVGGVAVDWLVPDDFAKQLIQRRGLQAGDILCVITCFAGIEHGAAEQLAQAIGARGMIGVILRAPEDYIHWNAGGELLLKNYSPVNETIRTAAKTWTRAEDKAWNRYVLTLKAQVVRALTAVPANAADAAAAYVLDFAARRPDDNKQNAIQALIDKAEVASPDARPAILQGIITQSAPVRRLLPGGTEFREGTHEDWSRELRTLLTDLHVLTDPAGGRGEAAAQVSEARAAMRRALADAWPTYSATYYGALRTLTAGTPVASQWRTFTSAVPVPVTPAEDQPGTGQTLDTATAGDDTRTVADMEAEIQQMLDELENL